MGRNGAGKTTLIKLICRLYDPTAGRILLDGIDIRDLDPDEPCGPRSRAMFQDYSQYQATAKENIGLGLAGPDRGRRGGHYGCSSEAAGSRAGGRPESSATSPCSASGSTRG